MPDTPSSPRTRTITVQGDVFGDRELTCEVVAGRLIAEGDIIVATEKGVDRRGLIVHRIERRKWPGGVVPYVVDEGLHTHTGKVRSAITDGMATIAAETSIRFVERDPERHRDFVRFVKDEGNNFSSRVGRLGGEQHIILGLSLDTPKVLHELLHALGLHHEHTRPDRGQFIEILRENIHPSRRHNFDANGGTVTGDYDYNSIMHYAPKNSFGIDGKPTMRSKTDRRISPGRRLSVGDVAALRQIYPESEARPDEPEPDKPEPDKPEPAKPDREEPKPDPTELLFQGGRFRATVEWKTSDSKGPGRAVPKGSDASGVFYFFNPTNYEILCKVLDGTAFNKHFWVYAAGATDIEWALTITDTDTDEVWTAHHPGGAPAPTFSDLEAFPEKTTS